MRKIHEVINKKTEKLNKPHFKTFNNNWLLIYDNTALSKEIIPMDKQKPLEYLSEETASYWENNSNDIKFDRVFIISGNRINYLSDNEG